MDAITGHYKRVMGAPGASSWNFDLSAIYQGRPQASASNADTFLPSEALKAVRGMNTCSAPGPDGCSSLMNSALALWSWNG